MISKGNVKFTGDVACACNVRTSKMSNFQSYFSQPDHPYLEGAYTLKCSGNNLLKVCPAHGKWKRETVDFNDH